ncbi:hypothetical protein [Priestia aryabhattai]|uniref:hypothetical protein n=1 Tax=Priestia aryabhattai TaxID=412384 RepID=UPI003735D278
MFYTSLVRLSNLKSLEEVEENLKNHNVLDQPVNDDCWPDYEILNKRWNPTSPFNNLNIQHLISGTREEIRFIFAEGYNERPKRKIKWFDNIEERKELLNKEERINKTVVKVVFFEHDNSVYMVPWMTPGTNLNTFCSDLLPLEYWGNVEKHPADFSLENDFFYWLLNSFTRGNKRISMNPSILIRSWTGFLGTTQDSTHTLTGEGEKISAILGTLAFIFMNDPFRALSINIQYENEKIPVVLGKQGNLEISEFEYEGQFSNVFLGDKRKIMLTVLMYQKVLPNLFKLYDEAIDSNDWNSDIKTSFTQWIGDEIISRVNEALGEIKNGQSEDEPTLK